MMKLILLFGFNFKTALDYTEGWYAGDVARMERALPPELAKRMYRKTSEVLGNNRRQSQQSRMELGLRVSFGSPRANDLDC